MDTYKAVSIPVGDGDGDDEVDSSWEAGDDFDEAVDDCLGDYDLDDL